MVKKGVIGLAKAGKGFRLVRGTKSNPRMGRKVFRNKASALIAAGVTQKVKKVVTKRIIKRKAKSRAATRGAFSAKRLFG